VGSWPPRITSTCSSTTAPSCPTRTVAIYQNQPVNADALQQMFVTIIANNRAGGWRTLKS
jgi:hypothetical protein